MAGCLLSVYFCCCVIASNNDNNYGISTALNYSCPTGPFKAHKHTHVHPSRQLHTRAYCIQFTTLTQDEQIISRGLNNGVKQQREREKPGRTIALEKEKFQGWIWTSPEKVFCRRRRGRSFHVEGSHTKKARDPTVESLVCWIWRARVSEVERRVQEGV